MAKRSGGGARGDEARRGAAGCASGLWSLAPWEGVGGETMIQGGGVAEKRPALRTTAYSSLPTSSKQFVRLARQNDAASQGKEYHDPRQRKNRGCMRRLSGLRFFMLRESVLSCFPGRLSCEQACLFSSFSKRMEVGQQIVCFRWFHSVRRVKGRASGIHRLRFTPFRRRKLMCNAAAASHRRTSRMVPSCPLNTPLEGDGENEVALFSLP